MGSCQRSNGILGSARLLKYLTKEMWFRMKISSCVASPITKTNSGVDYQGLRICYVQFNTSISVPYGNYNSFRSRFKNRNSLNFPIFLSWKQTSLLENAILYSRHSAGVGLVGTRRLVAHIPPTAAASSRRPSAMFRTYPAHRLSIARILCVPGCGLALGFLRSTIKVK